MAHPCKLTRHIAAGQFIGFDDPWFRNCGKPFCFPQCGFVGFACRTVVFPNSLDVLGPANEDLVVSGDDEGIGQFLFSPAVEAGNVFPILPEHRQPDRDREFMMQPWPGHAFAPR